MDVIGEFLFGTTEKALSVMKVVRPIGQPVLKTYVKICGKFSPYGLKHTGSITKMCNAGIKPEDLAKSTAYACATLGKEPLHPEIP
ncbi:hypothetical protein MKW98_029444 [Papaver atlanticum]|uniref:Legumain prodomain domain-containing protein n=1 Tax=Papaver atlanticum TaxID=357466 RepID=A0AAD4TDF8_9MAGN|nr:hypothetical protein MKW98_029444 [Papaver atlanticum]